MEQPSLEDDYFRQHNNAIVEQQRRFRMNIVRLRRQQQTQIVSVSKNYEDDTRGTSQEEPPLEHRGKTIGTVTQNASVMNVYVNNKLVQRSFNGFEHLIKSAKVVSKPERGRSDTMVQHKADTPFNMIIPYIEGRSKQRKREKEQKEQKSSFMKLSKLPTADMDRKDKLQAVYRAKKISDSRNNINLVQRQQQLPQDSPYYRKITEKLDTSGCEVSRKLQNNPNPSGVHLVSKQEIPKSDDRPRRLSPSRQGNRSLMQTQRDHNRSRDSPQRDSDHSRQIKVESILKRRSQTQDFDTYVSQFCVKMNYPPNTKLFVFKSKDDYVKRLLLKMGWVQNVLVESQAYHLKWTVSDSPDSYVGLFSGSQFFNHFANSFQLTSKTGLHNHFYLPNRVGVSHIYPRSFDLKNERQQFIQEYERTAVLCLLKKHIRYFASKQLERCEVSKKRLQQILADSDFNAQVFDQQFQINIPIVVQMCMYLENWRCLRMELPEPYTIESNTVNKLVGFSRVEPPYEVYNNIKKSQLEYTTSPTRPRQSSHKVVFSSDFRRYNATCPFGTPSTSLVELVFQFASYFERQLPYYRSDGQQNVWIVKAAASSKGAGISLEDKLTTIIEKGGTYKIVQKYVQRCLIFKEIVDPERRSLLGRKFDIRQWVLVKSFNPLQVFMYSDFYLRVCADEYDLADLKNPYKHLTNYSRNKSHFPQAKDSVMSSSEFKALLRNTTHVEYDKDIQPTIKSTIIRSLRSYQGVIKPNPSCFELYGYDFLLTEDYRPLLLQVNMSPACSQRTGWLTEMLDHMALGMLSLVLPKRYADLNCPANRWKLIFQD